MKRNASKRIAAALSAASIVLSCLSGCGGDGIRYAEVEGTVELNGKPLDKILVEFLPESAGPRSFAETDSQGKFKLKTDDGKRDGAAVGTHRVTLKDAGVHGDKFMGRAAETVDMSQGRKPRISDRLANPETSKMTQTVVAGKKNEFKIEATK